MSAAALMLLCACSGALFDVHYVPLDTPEARPFLAHAEADGIVDLFVLDGKALKAHISSREWARVDIPLAEGVSAFDIADIDGDGLSEVIAVCGERILRYAIPWKGDAAKAPAKEPELILERKTHLASPSERPYVHVMVVEHDGEKVLALPCEDALELWSFAGKRVAAYAMGRDVPKRVSFGVPFALESVYPPQAGPAGGLECLVSRVIDFEPVLPDELLTVKTAHDAVLATGRRSTFTQACDAATRDHGAWPWFAIGSEKGLTRRALYALAPPNYTETTICIRQAQLDQSGLREHGVDVGPPRRYRGTVVLAESDLPDFNGDGLTDLLLWTAPVPGTSVDALTQAAGRGTWPVYLRSHLFSAEKNRFEPKAAFQVACHLPVSWFWTENSFCPFRNLVVRDLNGDGASDLALSSNPRLFSVWLARKGRLPERPDYERTFSQDIESVAFRADLDGKGRVSVGLRGETGLYLLHAVGP